MRHGHRIEILNSESALKLDLFEPALAELLVSIELFCSSDTVAKSPSSMAYGPWCLAEYRSIMLYRDC